MPEKIIGYEIMPALKQNPENKAAITKAAQNYAQNFEFAPVMKQHGDGAVKTNIFFYEADELRFEGYLIMLYAQGILKLPVAQPA